MRQSGLLDVAEVIAAFLTIAFNTAGVYISLKAVTKPLGKVIGMLGNLEAFSPFNLIFFLYGGDVAGMTKRC